MKKTLKVISRMLPDKLYLKIKYFIKFKKKLNLKTPQTYNEKLQWLKLHDRRAIYTTMVDKYEAKKYVSNIIGEEYIIPTLGIYDSFDEINFNELPNQFVIKCTHDSGGLIIVKDKSKLNLKEAENKISQLLKENYYYGGREWPYKNVKPRIIIEKYMDGDDNFSENSLRDYKFFCFNGEVKMLYVSDDSHTEKQKIAFFDLDYNKLDIKRRDYGDFEELPKKPKTFEKMKKFAAMLSKGIPHLRVDFYEINGELFFGELTFSTGSGFIPFEDEFWNRKLGDYIRIQEVSSNNAK